MHARSLRKAGRSIGFALLAAFVLVSFAAAQDKREAPGGKNQDWLLLFTSAGNARAGALPAAPEASRIRAVTVNSSLAEPGGVAVGDRIYIAPFDDIAALGTVDRVASDVNGVTAVRARIVGSDGYLIMTSDGGRSHGRLVLPGGRAALMTYKLRRDPRVVVREGLNARYLERKDIGEPIGLENEPPDVGIERVLAIRAIVAAIAVPTHEHQAELGEPLQFLADRGIVVCTTFAACHRNH